MATEVYSIDSVIAVDPTLQQSHHYQPFYSMRHSFDREPAQTFWYGSRRPSHRKDDPGTEVYISLVDLGLNPNAPAVETITVHTTCTNRDLPSKLPFGGREGELDVEGAAPVSRVRC